MGLDVITCIIAIVVMGYGTWWVVRWFFKIGSSHSKKSESLSPSDLVVLEETTNRLMDDLKTVTNDCVNRIEQACHEAENRIAAAQNRGMHSDSLVIGLVDESVDFLDRLEKEPAIVSEPHSTEPPTGRVKGAQTVTSFARSTGLTTGEVELMRGLHEYGKSKKVE